MRMDTPLAGARRASSGNCFVCAGLHQTELMAAMCQPTDLDDFCRGAH